MSANSIKLHPKKIFHLIHYYYKFQNFKLKIVLFLLIIISFLQFITEIALAASLQSLLSIWGLLENPYSESSIKYSPYLILVFFIFIGTLRGLLMWGTTILAGSYAIALEVKIKSKITEFSLLSRNYATGKVADLFNDKALHSASFNGLILNFCNRLIITIGLLLYLFYLSPSLTLIAIISILILSVPIFILNKKLSYTTKLISENISSALNTLLSAVKNVLLIHIYGKSKSEINIIQGFLSSYQSNYLRFFIISGAKSSIPLMFGVWFIAILTISSTITNALKPHEIIAFFYIFLRFVGNISELSNLSSQLIMTYPRALTILDFFKNSQSVTTNFKSNEISSYSFSNLDKININIQNVSFSYPNGYQVFNNLNLKIISNSILLILGESGIGKSTLLSLIIGLEQPSNGKIIISDEHNSFELNYKTKANYIEKLGYVGPDNFIIPGTIRSNLTYGISNKTDQEIFSALKLADCNFVFDLNGQLNHILSEQGEGLSAGQKQRLSIARALLRKPKLLILDEATSNLDIYTEETILKTLTSLKKTMTIVVVSHRKSIKRYADQTFLMQKNPK